jgi:disulfide bond formation protein DsbB
VRDTRLSAEASIAYNCAMQQGVTSGIAVAGIAAASAAALAVAFVAQYGFGLAPCHLCLIQRLPYGAILAFALIAVTPALDPPARRQVAWLCAVLFALDAGIAVYHAGVENHWWEGPSSCTGGARQFSIEDLAKALTHRAAPMCDQAPFRVLGISMAGANAIAAAAFAIGAAAAAFRADWSR